MVRSAARLAIHEAGPRSIRQDIFAPNYRIADHQNLVGTEFAFDATLVKPVIAAEIIREAVVGVGIETLNPGPERRREEQDGDDDGQYSQPLSGREP